MKRACLLLMISIVFLSISKAKRIDGIIIRDNDTIRVLLEIPTEPFLGKPDYLRLQKSIIYYQNDKKRKIRPYEAKEVQFKMDNELTRMVSKRINIKNINASVSDSVMFLKLESDGYLKLFSLYIVNAFGPNTIICSMQKGDEDLKWVKFVKFRQDMIDYLNECNAIVGVINISKSSIEDLRRITEYYNQNCKSE